MIKTIIRERKKWYSIPKIKWVKVWQLKYRIYAVLVIIICFPLLSASDKNLVEDIRFNAFGYEIIPDNWLYSDIKKNTTKLTVVTTTSSSKFSSFSKSENASMISNNNQSSQFSSISSAESSSVIIENKVKKLEDIYTGIINPQITNLLVYEKYKIQAPIIWSTLEDLYNTNSDGTLNTDSYKNTSDPNSPIQIKLRDGIVHLAYSPLPGEISESGQISSSYIVGHSSNYSFVKSNYNTVFKPIEQKSSPGEEFIIYDKIGRKLTFRVFEALKIAEEDVGEAYTKNFAPRRVVTLQTSILGIRDGRIAATHRWLTRGELINPETKEVIL